MICRYDHDARDYLTPDGEPCRRDDYGDPTHHCTAKRTCSMHVAAGEQTCAKCLGRTRATIRGIVDLAALTPVEALAAGVDSEAASLAGPAADPEAWTWRKVAARQGRSWHASLIEEDDDLHPVRLLVRWHWMIAEDYGHDLPERMTLEGSAAYLDRQLGRIAQDEHQDFPLLAREVKACRDHLEVTLRNGENGERGAPCPECTSPATGVGPRLVRHYGHWCEDEDCHREHYDTDEADEWVCPADRERHRWSHEAYVRWIEERQEHVKRERMGA